MKTKYLPTFIKELKRLKSSSHYVSIRKFIFEEITICSDLITISNIKKLKSEINAYRWHIGDYRIGFFIENDTIIFARVLHRREFYRYFP